MLQHFEKDYTLSEEPFIFPKGEVYFIGSGAAKTCSVTKHGRHLGTILDFTENWKSGKNGENWYFYAWHVE